MIRRIVNFFMCGLLFLVAMVAWEVYDRRECGYYDMRNAEKRIECERKENQ